MIDGKSPLHHPKTWLYKRIKDRTTDGGSKKFGTSTLNVYAIKQQLLTIDTYNKVGKVSVS